MSQDRSYEKLTYSKRISLNDWSKFDYIPEQILFSYNYQDSLWEQIVANIVLEGCDFTLQTVVETTKRTMKRG